VRGRGADRAGVTAAGRRFQAVLPHGAALAAPRTFSFSSDAEIGLYIRHNNAQVARKYLKIRRIQAIIVQVTAFS
jgi:hypothetical protein